MSIFVYHIVYSTSPVKQKNAYKSDGCTIDGGIFGAGSGNRTRTLSLEGSYDTISPYPLMDTGN